MTEYESHLPYYDMPGLSQLKESWSKAKLIPQSLGARLQEVRKSPWQYVLNHKTEVTEFVVGAVAGAVVKDGLKLALVGSGFWAALGVAVTGGAVLGAGKDLYKQHKEHGLSLSKIEGKRLLRASLKGSLIGGLGALIGFGAAEVVANQIQGLTSFVESTSLPSLDTLKPNLDQSFTVPMPEQPSLVKIDYQPGSSTILDTQDLSVSQPDDLGYALPDSKLAEIDPNADHYTMDDVYRLANAKVDTAIASINEVIPDTVELPAGSNPWQESEKCLTEYLKRPPTPEEIAEVDTALCRASGIISPTLGVYEGNILDINLPAGYQLNFGQVKGVISSLAAVS